MSHTDPNGVERGARGAASSASRSSNGVGSSPERVRGARGASAAATGSTATASPSSSVGAARLDAGLLVAPAAATTATAASPAAPAPIGIRPQLALGALGALDTLGRVEQQLDLVAILGLVEVVGDARRGPRRRAGELLAGQGHEPRRGVFSLTSSRISRRSSTSNSLISSPRSRVSRWTVCLREKASSLRTRSAARTAVWRISFSPS